MLVWLWTLRQGSIHHSLLGPPAIFLPYWFLNIHLLPSSHLLFFRLCVLPFPFFYITYLLPAFCPWLPAGQLDWWSHRRTQGSEWGRARPTGRSNAPGTPLGLDHPFSTSTVGQETPLLMAPVSQWRTGPGFSLLRRAHDIIARPLWHTRAWPSVLPLSSGISHENTKEHVFEQGKLLCKTGKGHRYRCQVISVCLFNINIVSTEVIGWEVTS